ncbi:two-component sensor histidine kinase, partial [bacterium]|nr:two-component sensor histidine kinase [bacterium]
IENIRQMADGNFEKPLKVQAGTEQETAELARQYNRMLSALTERDKKIQQQQRDLLQSERLAAVGQLSAEIVHEIRNPLNSINLNIDWLQEELRPASPEVEKTLSSISREVARLHQLTETHLVRARFPAKSARTPVNDLIREIVDFNAEENRSQQIHVDLALWPEELYVQSERGRLKQAILNVLRNAREAMPRGGKVSISTEVQQNIFRIKVADTGSGMNDSTRRQTFQPFFTTKPDGTGLGLMVTRTIVEEAHGSVHCESNIGQGTTVYFQFPV